MHAASSLKRYTLNLNVVSTPNDIGYDHIYGYDLLFEATPEEVPTATTAPLHRIYRSNKDL